MKVEQAKQIASKAIEQLSQALEAGHSEKLREYLAAMARFHRYSLHNIMLIASQRPDATHVAGFQTWKQLGRFVKKGAKGILILAPVVLRKETESNNHEEETERTAIRFRAVYVFDVADTDGRPLPELGNAEGDPSGHTQRLKDFIASRGIQLEYSDAIYPAQGQCSPGKDRVAPRPICRRGICYAGPRDRPCAPSRPGSTQRDDEDCPGDRSRSRCIRRLRSHRPEGPELRRLHPTLFRRQGDAGRVAGTRTAASAEILAAITPSD